MTSPFLSPALLAAALCAATTVVQATSPAAVYCPPSGFLSGNLVPNPGFETPDPDTPAGTTTCWTPTTPNGDSAAEAWSIHSSNVGAKVCSTLVSPSTAPGHQGGRMLKFKAGGNEGGVFHRMPDAPGKTFMFSAWVKVMRGQVALQSNGGAAGPVSWSSHDKLGQWEQLRVCTDATGTTDTLIIYNQDPAGGLFYVDGVELRETLPGN